MALVLHLEDRGTRGHPVGKRITDDKDELLAFFDHPAEHWIRLRTMNPVQAAFVTVRLRTKAAKGAGSRATGLAVVIELVEAARSRWRTVNAPHLDAPHFDAPVRAEARFGRGHPIEREEVSAA